METTPKRFYYGWVNVLAAFLTVFVTVGILLYTFSLFLVPVSEEFGVPRTEVAFASSIYMVLTALSGVVAGILYEKGYVRYLLMASAVCFGGGFMLQSVAQSLGMFYVFYALVGIGAGVGGPAVNFSMVSYWFEKKKGLAIGIAACGSSICGLIIPGVVTNLTANYSWRTAYLVVGAIAFVLLMISALLAKTKPQDIGLLPDGLTEDEAVALPAQERPVLAGLNRSAAIKTPSFWLLGIALIFSGIGQIGIMQNAAASLIDMQFDMKIVASTLGYIGISALISKLLFGYLVDKLNPKLAFTLGVVVQIAGTIILAEATPASGYAYLMSYAVLFGLGTGAWGPTITVIVGRSFGMKYYASLWALIFIFKTVGDIVGVPGISGLASSIGYSSAFYVAAVCTAAFIGFVLMTKNEQTQKRVEVSNNLSN